MSLTGDLAATPLSDLIEFFCMRQETAAIAVRTGDGHGGVLFIEGGAVVDARLDDLIGEGAVRAALRMNKGDFRVEREVRCQQRTIFEPWKKLILEAAQLEDEAQHARQTDANDSKEPTVPSNGNVVAMRCNTCGREYHGGTVCPHDGAALVPRGPQERPSSDSVRPVAGVRQLPTPQSSRAATPVVHPSVRSEGPEGSDTNRIEDLSATGRQPTAPPPAPASKRVVSLVVLAALVTVAALLVVISQRGDGPAAPALPRAAVSAATQPATTAPSTINGVTDTEILFGMSAPFSGSAKELGRGMKTGVEVAFAAVNEAGGIYGRKLQLIALDDGYEPARTKETMKELIEKRKVFGIIGNVGTPTAAVAAPFALDHKTLFFGAFTGAPLLRKDPPDRYVFNYRASYAEETAAVVRYLVEQRRVKPDQIAVFAQEDGYGDAGYAGVASELRRKYQRDPATILRVGYKRNSADVQDAVGKVLAAKDIRAVVMVPAYRAAARFVEKVKEKRPDMIFTSVSFVGASALAEEFQQLNPRIGEGVIVTQVVPLPTARSSVALRYQELLTKHAPGERPDFVSFEGYLAANVLIEALKRHGRALDTESLVGTLEGLRGLDLGIGNQLSFGLSEHQASHKIWGTVLDAQGGYQTVELE